MNDLIKAAKALIADWDKRQVVGDADLRAAVLLAEKSFTENQFYEHGYAAGQKAMQRHERERIKLIIHHQFSELVSDLSEVMEMIDAAK